MRWCGPIQIALEPVSKQVSRQDHDATQLNEPREIGRLVFPAVANPSEILQPRKQPAPSQVLRQGLEYGVRDAIFDPFLEIPMASLVRRILGLGLRVGLPRFVKVIEFGIKDSTNSHCPSRMSAMPGLL